jgi:hypothetical protein
MESNASAINKAAVMQLEPTRTRREVFQRDFLSPLVFCMGRTLIINKLNIADCGSQVLGAERKNLRNMNDLKLLCGSK